MDSQTEVLICKKVEFHKWDHKFEIKQLHSVVAAFLFDVRNLLGTLIFDSCFSYLLNSVIDCLVHIPYLEV